MTDVVLVVMPFADLPRPSAALSLLQAVLQRDGLSCRVLYGPLRFARQLGLGEYERLTAQGRVWGHHGYCELLFSRCLFPDHPVDWAAVTRTLRIDREPGLPVSTLEADTVRLGVERLAAQADRHLDEMVETVLALKPRIVGCTSSFEQHLASLALLHRLRQRAPEIVTMLGGANCEQEMGAATHRLFPWVDFVVSGEADKLVAPLCRAILEQGPALAQVPEGVFHRGSAPAEQAPRAVFQDLDELPVPDFRDFFTQLEESGLASYMTVGLPMETSRGCWWGARSHCTFCGLNGMGMAYRAKSADRVIHELEEVADRTGIHRIELVDNILDMKAFDTWLPRMAASGRPWSLFVEVKSNLREEQVRLMAEAGLRWLQPGIESLDSRLLALMRKGARSWQQVQLLKLAREHGIFLFWNLLVGFPGEEDEWHAETARLLPALFHLQPPSTVTAIRYDRFSPYFEKQAEFGLDLEPHPLTEAYYPFPLEDRVALSYHFQRRDKPLNGRPSGPGHEALERETRRWRQAFTPLAPTLWMRDLGERLAIADTRPGAGEVEFEIDGLQRAVVLAASQAVTPDALSRECAALLGRAPEAGELAEALEALQARRLVVGLDGRWLSLVLRESTPTWPPVDVFPGGAVVQPRTTDLGEDTFRSLFGLPRVPA